MLDGAGQARTLRDGDLVTVFVEGIGELTNTCRYEPQAAEDESK